MHLDVSPLPTRLTAITAAFAAVIALVGCESGQPAARRSPTPASTPSPMRVTPSATASPTPPPPVHVVAAGDIASCSSPGDEQTARVVDRTRGPILLLGDIAYERGTRREFAECFAPSWGRHIARMRPAPGNHEYFTKGATGYYEYFGRAAGSAREGWYSFAVGTWHVIALNSNCTYIGGCGPDSRQVQWLRSDLAAHPGRCTLAYWHHPRFSSGRHHGSDVEVDTLWRTLHAAGADVVLAGHEHQYERFAPLDASGRPSEAGLRSFVVGTGGRSKYPFGAPLPGSEARAANVYGVLDLALADGSYSWHFLSTTGKYVDAGSGRCR